MTADLHERGSALTAAPPSGVNPLGPPELDTARRARPASGELAPAIANVAEERTANGERTKGHSDARDLVHTWPHLVYRELCALLLASAVLWIVSLLVDAPLEEMANASLTPNPAKAPWYFLGLQELLVYFDPWIAGVAIPGLIILGLAAIPYLDPGREGTGACASPRRRFAISVFLFGLALWFLLIFIGTYCRGPNWAWYWPWEDQTLIKPTTFLTRDLPAAVGVPAVLLYFGGGLIAPRLIWRRIFGQLGLVRYATVIGLLLLMIAVPLKIVLRLAFHVKYVLVTPWFNI